MAPKEKAEELVDTFKYYVLETDCFGDNVELKYAKKCALIAVDEIIEIVYNSLTRIRELKYWQEVKQEIEKL